MFASVLLKWFKENGRDLPWRQTRDPYAIWLSEIILQQTRVEQGRAYYERFISVFPTVPSLVSSSDTSAGVKNSPPDLPALLAYIVIRYS